jgi:Xaa-Pro aminopeptidase
MMSSEFAARRSRIAADFAELGVDAFIVSALPNIRYLTGFTGSNALALLTEGRPLLFTDPRYEIQAAAETECQVTIVRKGSMFAAVGKAISRKRRKKIGFEKNRMTYAGFRELQESLQLSASLEPIAGYFEQLRMIKSESEIALIREAVLTNSQALERVLPRLQPSMTESEVAAELEYQMRCLGAEKPAFDTIVAAGTRSALPHARPGNCPIVTENGRGNQLLLIDMGALQAGYASDMTRVLHIGKPGPKVRKLYKAVLEAQEAASDAVRPGVKAGAVDQHARRVLARHGLDRMFVHSTGHGLGLEIHEPPRLGKRDQTKLEAGMVITIEPGAYIEGFGGVRIEDTIVVTASGREVLTPSPKELFVL